MSKREQTLARRVREVCCHDLRYEAVLPISSERLVPIPEHGITKEAKTGVAKKVPRHCGRWASSASS
jgi:hypothetical protein